MEALLERIKKCNKNLEMNTASLGLVDTKLDTYAEVCKNGYDQLREVKQNEFEEVVDYLEENGYLTDDDDKPESFMDALQVIGKKCTEYCTVIRIRETASKVEAERFKTDLKNAKESEYKKGYDEGYKQGLNDGDNKIETYLQEIDRLKARIKELEQMYDDMVAKKAKPATPRWITEIGSVFKSITSKASREEWQNAYKLEDGTVAALDGFRILKTSEPVDVVVAQHSDTMVQMFKNVLKDTSCCEEAHELPQLSVLKALDDEAKKTKSCKTAKGMYLFEHKGVRYGFNIKYLMDGMKATHSNIIMLSKPNGIAIMESEDKKTFYLCLPINVSQLGAKELDKVHYL